MSILTVVQQVSMAVGLTRPLSLFADPGREMQEMQAVVNEAARVIAEAYDWQALRKPVTLTGNGSAEAFDLPADFGRMLKTARLWSSRYRDATTHVVDTDRWLELDVIPAPTLCGLWTLYGNQIHVRPVMQASETARFFYIRNQIVSGGKAEFSADEDAFILDERLLKLCATYLWKQGKGQDFIAELSDYEQALMQETRKDGGSLPVVSGNRGVRPSNVWPGTVRL